MNFENVISKSEDETRQLGLKIAQSLNLPIAIGLVGTLGAGKTLVAKSMIEAFEVDPDQISSPTFTICQEHSGKIQQRDVDIYHVDLYRVANEDELIELGPEQWLPSTGLSIFEWADRFSMVEDECDLLISIEQTGHNEREFSFRFLLGSETKFNIDRFLDSEA